MLSNRIPDPNIFLDLWPVVNNKKTILSGVADHKSSTNETVSTKSLKLILIWSVKLIKPVVS